MRVKVKCVKKRLFSHSCTHPYTRTLEITAILVT
jgi:hypothetical protein